MSTETIETRASDPILLDDHEVSVPEDWFAVCDGRDLTSAADLRGFWREGLDRVAAHRARVRA